MINWCIKRYICSKVTNGLKNATVDAARTTVKVWLGRLQAIMSCLSSVLAKLDDGKLDGEELDAAISDAEKLIREW